MQPRAGVQPHAASTAAAVHARAAVRPEARVAAQRRMHAALCALALITVIMLPLACGGLTSVVPTSACAYGMALSLSPSGSGVLYLACYSSGSLAVVTPQP